MTAVLFHNWIFVFLYGNSFYSLFLCCLIFNGFYLLIQSIDVTSAHIIFASNSVYFPSSSLVFIWFYLHVYFIVWLLYFIVSWIINYFHFPDWSLVFEFSQSKYIYIFLIWIGICWCISLALWLYLQDDSLFVFIWFLLEFITFFLSTLFYCLERTSSDVFWLFRRETSWVLCRKFSMSLK